MLRFVSVLAALLVASCVASEPPGRYVSSYKPPPKDEVIPFSSLRLVEDANISWQHYALEGVDDLPPEGIEVTQICRINRERGRLYICLLPDGASLMYVHHVAAADRRIAQMKFDMSRLPPPTGKVEVTNITVRLTPQDRREL